MRKEDEKISKREKKQKERDSRKYQERELNEKDIRIKLEKTKPEKKTIFGKIFGRKKDKIDVSKELESIEKPKPEKRFL
jgi:hypothetical protein